MVEVYNFAEEAVQGEKDLVINTDFQKGDIRKITIINAVTKKEIVYNRIDNKLIITLMDNGKQLAKEGFLDLERHTINDFHNVCIQIFKGMND